VGSLSPTINWKTLREQVFPLPPLDEQKRIAEILWVASLEQEAMNNVLEANRALLLRKLSEISRFLNPKDRTYPWEESKLGTVFKHKKDKGYSDLPTLSVTIDGKIVPRDSLNRNVEDRTGPEKCFRVDPGDIAYNTMRMWQGACALSTDSGVISPAYTVISIKSKDQLTEFWIRVFRTPWMKKTFERFSTGVASDRWRLYYRDFSAIKIKRPPLTFQQNVLDELFALELAVKSAEVSVQNSIGLQKALIQKYLTGATYV
jgi:type I restriction enzyme S subunit